jgi:3-deoxy-D-manno-octulosonic-acid transferase
LRLLYSVVIRIAAPVAFAVLLWRGLSDRGYWQGLKERFGFGTTLGAPSLWLHAVSLGEMSAAAPLVRALHARHPELRFTVTTATPAGRARAQALFSDFADVRFTPYDTPGAVRRFLARIRPRIAIIMETELWPNLLHACEAAGVPVLLASARLSEKSVSRYRRFGALFGGIFTSNLMVAAQTADDARRFAAIGARADQIQIVGNVKFDLLLEDSSVAAGRNLREQFAARPVWIAGSTHAGEEEQLLDAHAALLAHLPTALLLLAPRHKDRFAAVAELLTRRGVSFQRRSDMLRHSGATAAMRDAAVLLVDTVGELAALYAAADVAFVGGSLVAIGGHNLLEPAALALPVITGPSYFNAKEIAQLMLAEHAALLVSDAPQLAMTVQSLLLDPMLRARIGAAGRAMLEANRGSVERLLALIEPRLAAHPSGSAPAALP